MERQRLNDVARAAEQASGERAVAVCKPFDVRDWYNDRWNGAKRELAEARAEIERNARAVADADEKALDAEAHSDLMARWDRVEQQAISIPHEACPIPVVPRDGDDRIPR
jgi:hypothetical protein